MPQVSQLLIYRQSDISTYFRKFRRFRDDENRLTLFYTNRMSTCFAQYLTGFNKVLMEKKRI